MVDDSCKHICNNWKLKDFFPSLLSCITQQSVHKPVKTTVGQHHPGSWTVNEKCVKCRRLSQHFSWKHNFCQSVPASLFGEKPMDLVLYHVTKSTVWERGITVSQVVGVYASLNHITINITKNLFWFPHALKCVWHNLVKLAQVAQIWKKSIKRNTAATQDFKSSEIKVFYLIDW